MEREKQIEKIKGDRQKENQRKTDRERECERKNRETEAA